jgi:hypothetical protein
MTDEPRAFASQYEQWFYEGRKQDDRLAGELTKTYPEFWREGGRDDLFAIINFIYEQKDHHGFAFIVEALGSNDERFAAHAASLTLSLITEGYAISGVKEALTTFITKYPDWAIFAETSLELLESGEVKALTENVRNGHGDQGNKAQPSENGELPA